MIASAIAVAALAWLTLLVLTPFAPSLLATVMYEVGRVICHQISERSFHLAGFQIPVCARCLGIYAGFAVASVVVLAGSAATWSHSPGLTARMARRVFIVAAVPTVMTVGLEGIGIWSTTNVVRAIAGAVLGIGLAFVVMSAVATLHYSACQRRRPLGPSQLPPPT